MEKLGLSRTACLVDGYPVHLATEFHRFYHCTIGDYTRRLRVEVARRELIARKAAKFLFWVAGLFALVALAVPVTAFGQERLVDVANRRLAIDCAGSNKTQQATVILIAGGGRTKKEWAKVQPNVASFVRVCSYDRAGLGNSDKPAAPQSADEIVADLHALLKASGEQEPYILAGHSVGGLYARLFTTKYPKEVAALLFIDSAHEEQAWRIEELAPTGKGVSDKVTRAGFIAKMDERLTWQTKVPLIVLAHGKTFAHSPDLTEAQWTAWEGIWRDMQKDLAKRSPKGEFRLAANSGHNIHLDEPELVIQAIRDLCAGIKR